MRTKKLISILIALAMAVSLLPGVSLTAFAAQSQTVITTGTTVKDTTITGNFDDGKSAYLIQGDGNIEVTFQNVTFDNVKTNVYGSCVHVNKSSGELKLKFINCRFINCGNGLQGGGAIYIQKVPQQNSIKFENCYADKCQAKWGGFMYADAQNANISAANTVISNCSASTEGGAVCIWDNDKIALDGFVFVGNTSKYGGAIYNNGSAYGNGITNCRFYRNKNTEANDGNAVYLNDSNAKISYCTFIDNAENGKSELYYKNAESVKDCAYISSCKLSGEGEKDNPYTISSTDDWDTLYYKVKNGDSFAKKYFVLNNNITAYTPIGMWSGKPFPGNFNGNGKTITLNLPDGASNNAAFNYTIGATIENLTTDGFVKGDSGAGGIISHAENTMLKNCINHAEVVGNSYVGGILGYSKNTKVYNCINCGSVSGTDNIGGITGQSDENSEYENCFYNRQIAPPDSHGTGISSVAMFGEDTDIIDGKYYIMPNCVNDYIRENKLGVNGFEEIYLDSYKILHFYTADKGQHAWEYINGNEHECKFCGKVEKHIKGDDGICVKCRGIVVSYLTKSYQNETVITEKKSDIAKVVYKDTSRFGEDNAETWYAVIDDIELENGSQVSGKVHLILTNGKTLKAPTGIWLRSGAELIIHAQSDDEADMGSLVAGDNAQETSPGIGGNGNVTIHGGNITATGGKHGAGIGSEYYSSCQKIAIYGGNITATGGYESAGIGSARDGSCSGITIHGGNITATGSSGGAGIGGGYWGSCATITINGGDVTAISGGYGTGIGSGGHSSCMAITINGGNITATGETNGAGIGDGYGGKCSAITINGGDITATGGTYGAGIGSGYKGNCEGLTICGGDITATGGKHGAGIGSGYQGSCNSLNVSGGRIVATGGEKGTAFKGDEEKKAGTITIEPSLTVRIGDEKGEKVKNPEDYAKAGLENKQITIISETEKPEANKLSLEIKDNTFTVIPSGENEGSGTVVVAIYDSKNRLINVKSFDIKTQTPEGTFDQSGYIKAFWWSDLAAMLPYCEAVGKYITQAE